MTFFSAFVTLLIFSMSRITIHKNNILHAIEPFFFCSIYVATAFDTHFYSHILPKIFFWAFLFYESTETHFSVLFNFSYSLQSEAPACIYSTQNWWVPQKERLRLDATWIFLFPCALLSPKRKKEAQFFVTPSENFPVNVQSKLPFHDACLSLGSWDYSLKISLDSGLYFFSLRPHYSVKNDSLNY